MKYTTSVSDILHVMLDEYGIPPAVLTSPSRSRAICHVRRIAVYLAVNLTYLSKDDIALRFNMKDHSSISYGYKKLAELINKDATIKKEVSSLIKRLESQ